MKACYSCFDPRSTIARLFSSENARKESERKCFQSSVTDSSCRALPGAERKKNQLSPARQSGSIITRNYYRITKRELTFDAQNVTLCLLSSWRRTEQKHSLHRRRITPIPSLHLRSSMNRFRNRLVNAHLPDRSAAHSSQFVSASAFSSTIHRKMQSSDA